MFVCGFRKYALIGLILFMACEDSHVDRMRLELMERRLAVLEASIPQLNANIRALQLLVDALNTSAQIVSVTETPKGYTLVMSDNSVIDIYHGKNGLDGVEGTEGKDGETPLPLVSVRDSSDGHTYWTVNGKLLSGVDGKPVRADGDKGEAGTPGSVGVPGVTPRIRIHTVTNEWETSVDCGFTWHTTGIKATGEKGPSGESGDPGATGTPGDAVFAPGGINVQEHYIEFTLSDGTQFRVPRYSELFLQFPLGTDYPISQGTTLLIPFTVIFTTGIPVVNALDNGGWMAEVRMDAGKKDSGVIAVTAPPTVGSGSVIVLLDDGEGRCWTYRLTLTTVL